MPREVTSQTELPRALLNRRDTATYLGVSIWTVDKLVHNGNLTPLQLTPGGAWMFRVRDLNALIEKRAATRVPRRKWRGGGPHRAEATR